MNSELSLAAMRGWKIFPLVHRSRFAVSQPLLHDNLSEEVRKGMTEKAEQGIWPSRAPLGYLNAKLPSGKKGIVLDENRAKLVRRLFEMYATGNFSLKQLTQWA